MDLHVLLHGRALPESLLTFGAGILPLLLRGVNAHDVIASIRAAFEALVTVRAREAAIRRGLARCCCSHVQRRRRRGGGGCIVDIGRSSRQRPLQETIGNACCNDGCKRALQEGQTGGRRSSHRFDACANVLPHHTHGAALIAARVLQVVDQLILRALCCGLKRVIRMAVEEGMASRRDPKDEFLFVRRHSIRGGASVLRGSHTRIKVTRAHLPLPASPSPTMTPNSMGRCMAMTAAMFVS